MKQRYGNRALIVALALSLAVHALIALVARVQRVEAAPQERPTRMQIVRIEHSPPPPTPTPVPQIQPQRPRVVAQARPAARPRIAPPRQNAPATGATSGPVVTATSGAGEADDPHAVAAGSPAPARPACSAPDVPAHAISAAMPQTPEGVEGLPATAQVQVTLDAAGHVTGLQIYQSAGDPRLDRAAAIAARASTYAPALVDCAPAGGTYLFQVEFQE